MPDNRECINQHKELRFTDHAWIQITIQDFENMSFNTYMTWDIRGCKYCGVMQYRDHDVNSYYYMSPVEQIASDQRRESIIRYYWRRLALFEDGYYDM